MSDAQLETILEHIRLSRRFDFRNYKRATLKRRVERRMIARKCKTLKEYLDLLVVEPPELEVLICEMFINVTAFFRDEELWRTLERNVIPGLVRDRRPHQEIRVWCAGCATGQEAYSIAMLIAEALGPELKGTELKVFATDVDLRALSVARRGIYNEHQLEPVSLPLRERWFVPVAEGFQLRKEIRRSVVFGINNLVSDAPISRLDLLICRNVFIYFDAELQTRVLSRFHYALRRDALLVLGKSELIPQAAEIFQPLDLARRIYRKQHIEGMLSVPERDPPPAHSPPPTTALPNQETPVLNQIHRDVLSVLPVPVIATAPDGTVALWNKCAAALWGKTEAQVVGKKLAGLGLVGLSGDLVVKKSVRVREGRSESEVSEGAIRVPGQSGSNALSIEVTALKDGGRVVVGLLYVAHDVTIMRGLQGDLKQANENLTGSSDKLRTSNEELQSSNQELETTNEELQSANEELDATNRELASRTEEMHRLALYQRTIIRSLSAAVVVIDTAGRITAWNLAAERLLGLAESEALGQFLWNLHVPALNRSLVANVRKSIAAKRALRIDDVRYELATGGEGHATLAAVPLIDGTVVLGAVILFEDTTRASLLGSENLRLKAHGQKPAKAPAPQAKKSAKTKTPKKKPMAARRKPRR